MIEIGNDILIFTDDDIKDGIEHDGEYNLTSFKTPVNNIFKAIENFENVVYICDDYCIFLKIREYMNGANLNIYGKYSIKTYKAFLFIMYYLKNNIDQYYFQAVLEMKRRGII